MLCNKCGTTGAEQYDRIDKGHNEIRTAALCKEHVKLFKKMGFILVKK
jgi:hypothetical protein